MATKKHLSAEEDEELGSGSHHAASSDAGGRSELNWDDFESIWKRKLEKLFFSALQLEHGVGGPDGAYAKKDKARLKELAYEAERQFRTIAAVLMLHRRSKSEEQLSVYDLQKFFRQHPLRLKCLNIDDSELDVLEKELQDIADDRQGPIQIISKSFSVPINGAVALSGKGETASRRPAPAAWFKCRKSKPDKLDDVEWDKQAQVEQLMLGYENFRWVIEVVCRENLGGMSVGEFSRLVFLEKAVELNVHQHRPASFRNLQNNEAHSHHHPRHTKADHLIPPNVSAVKLWGDIWGLVCVFERGRGRERGREAREGERETETEKEKETETESAASIEVGHEYQNP